MMHLLVWMGRICLHNDDGNDGNDGDDGNNMAMTATVVVTAVVVYLSDTMQL